MLQLKSFLKVIDNSGALVVECINVIGKRIKVATVGDEIVCVVKKAKSVDQSASLTAAPAANNPNLMVKLKKGQVARAVVVRTKKEVMRKDGTIIQFDDNACVMVNKLGQPLGNRVMGAIAMEARQRRWAKVVSLAPKVV
jgi:large subunit ribosomal protein L14